MTQQPSILIVDDESGILDTLRILLRKEGFEVTTAQGGKAGLDQIRSGSHDIVLTDVRMPQVTGLDILQAAKEQDLMTPVILMTAQASLQTAVAAVNAGAFYYIQKPFSNDELLAILRRACEYRQIRVENRQLKQDIRRKDKSTVTRPVGLPGNLKSETFEILGLGDGGNHGMIARWAMDRHPSQQPVGVECRRQNHFRKQPGADMVRTTKCRQQPAGLEQL